ncbi:amino acid adenylation domain-containing protein, partial [Lysobacter fragariae]
LESDTALWAQYGTDNPVVDDLAAHHLAYIIYTSGSTGAPKGVMIEHRNVTRLFAATDAWFHFDANDVWTLFHSFAFDFSVWEIWGALLYGGRLVVVPHATSRAPDDFYRLLCEQKVTILNQTPSAFSQLIAAQSSSDQLHSLRRVIFGGEALEMHSLASWYARNDGNQPLLINMYGITETTVHVTYRPIDPADVERHKGRSPIGARIPDLALYILDEHRQPVPIGAAGELYVGGAGVARGYLNRAELTAERFIANPFAANERLYKTGDLARWRADGDIEYLGRNDFQVKIRGFRIELGEIEARLAAHPDVREAAVLAREDRPGDKRLVAYVTPQDGVALDLESLRAHLRGTLPEYMVPAAYVTLPVFPLTPNGKLDRKALPAPDADSYIARNYEAPIGDIETALASIWAELLKLERVGRHDNFFELGGHSLLALTLVERMRGAGMQVDVRALFAAPVLMDLAAAVGGGSANRTITVPPNLIPADCDAITPDMLPMVQLSQADIDSITATVPGGARNVQDIYPLAPLQEGFLFHYLLEKEGDVYLTTSVLSASTRAQIDRYVAALQVVINRHDILRTAVHWEGLPEPVQVVVRRAPLVVEEVTLDPADGDIATQLQARFDPRHYRLDVRQAPLWRWFVAFDAPNQRWVALEMVHHLVDDRTTIEFLHAELQAVLQGRGDQLPPPLPFRDFVFQARNAVSREEHEAFFARMLGDVDEPTTPFGLLDAQGDGSRILATFRDLDPRLSRRLRACARTSGVSVASLCHLAWAIVLARVSGRDDVVFGTVMFGRMQGGEGANRAFGLFINSLPVRIKVDGEGAQAGLRRTHQLLTQLMHHEHAPLALAQRCSAVRAPTPLFTAMLNYRHAGEDQGTGDSLESWSGLEELTGEERTNYPLGLAVNDLGEGFSIDVQADESVDPEHLCELVIATFESLATALESTPTTPLRQLQILPPSQCEALLALGSGGPGVEATANADARLYDLVIAQAQRTPDAIAIAEPGRDVTYQDVVRRANGVAHRLAALDVGPETRVAILADRSAESLIGTLGILASGAAYVPLDPNSPAERLASLLDNASARALLAPSTLRAQAEAMAQRQPALTGKVLVVADMPFDDTPPTSGVHADNAAYVIYTSGTTGASKGVVIDHRSAMNLVHGFIERHDFAGHRLLMIPPLIFDASVGDVFPALGRGATLVLHPAPTELDAVGLQAFCAESRITAIDTPAALWRRWTEEFASMRDASPVLPGVTLVMFGGEGVPLEQVRRFSELTQGRITLSNHYGPTEASVCATLLNTCDGSELRGSELAIGKPLPGVQVYVLDPELKLLPLGVEGELYIGGNGVARGYLGADDLTVDRFLRDPYSQAEGARIYRTGDMARWNPDGTLQFLGRRDHQVKIRGFRIELGEIETRLASHPDVREAVVLAREDRPGDKRLVAYVTPQDEGIAVEREALRAHLQSALPEYMVPAAYVTLSAFPLTPNGKLDRKALPAPEAEAYATRAYEAPVGDVETAIARIWADVLKLERVGRHDNFFELGGHSLLVMRVVSLLRQAGVAVTVTDLFNRPTVALLAEPLSSVAVTLPPTGAIKVRGGAGTPLFLVHDGYGDELYFSALARHLPDDLPVYGLPSVPLDEPQLHTMSALAARMVGLMRHVQPHGPYRLAGWSFGGVLCVEIAQQLLAQREQVEFLGLLDSFCPEGTSQDANEQSPESVLRALCEESLEHEPCADAILAAFDSAIGFDALFHRYRELDALPENFSYLTSQQALLQCRHLHLHARAMDGYVPQPLRIPVHLFVAQERPAGFPPVTAALGWERCIPAHLLHVAPVNGSHESMMRSPNVSGLGKKLALAMTNERAREMANEALGEPS